MIGNNYPLSIPRDSLVGEWLLDGDAVDTSGEGKDGSATDITWTDGNLGFQKQFGDTGGADGDWVDIPNTLDIAAGSDLTISIWANAGAFSNNDYVFNLRGQFAYSIIMYDNKFQSRTHDGVLQLLMPFSAGSMNTGQWYHLVMTHTASTKTVSVYLDGKFVDSDTYSGTIQTTANDNSLFAFDGTQLSADVSLAMARVYKRELSQTEINVLRQEGLRKLGQDRGNYPALMSDLVFGMEFNNNFNDIIGGGNGTEINTVAYSTDLFGTSNRALLGNNDGWIDALEQHLGGTEDFSYEFVLRWTSASDGTQQTLYSDSNDGAANFHQIMFNREADFDTANGKMMMLYKAGGGFVGHGMTTTGLNDGDDHHFVFTRTGATWKWYVDGVVQTNEGSASAGDISTGSKECTIFADLPGNGKVQAGSALSYFRTYTKELSAGEVAALNNLATTKYIYPFNKTMPANLFQRLTAWYNFDTDGTNWYDASGNGNDGTDSNMDATDVHRILTHKYVTFNGSNDSISTGITTTTVDDYSINFWFKASGQSNLAAYGGGDTANRIKLELRSGNKIRSEELRNSQTLTLESTKTPQDGEWHMVTVTSARNTSGGFKLYIDGVSEGTPGNVTDNDIDVDDAIALGAHNNNGSLQQWAACDLKDWMYFEEHILTQTEIYQLYYSRFIQEK